MISHNVRAGIDRAIVDSIVDKALFLTFDKHASLSTTEMEQAIHKEMQSGFKGHTDQVQKILVDAVEKILKGMKFQIF